MIKVGLRQGITRLKLPLLNNIHGSRHTTCGGIDIPSAVLKTDLLSLILAGGVPNVRVTENSAGVPLTPVFPVVYRPVLRACEASALVSSRFKPTTNAALSVAEGRYESSKRI